MKKVLAWVIALAIISIGIYLLNNHASASFTLPVCNVDHKYDCVTPTPTTNPCKFWEEDKWEEDCITPTTAPSVSPTVTPEASPSAVPSPVPNTQTSSTAGASGGQSNNPPPIAQCQNNSFVGPVVVGFTDKGNGTMNVEWQEITGGINSYSIVYGYSPDALAYGENNIPGNVWNWDIHDLAIGNHVWVRVIAWQNGCSVASNLFDPIIH